MKPDQVKQFLATTPGDFTQRCIDHATEFQAMVSSPAYALWMEMVGVMEASFKHNAAEALTLEEREEARNDMLALRRMTQAPLVLAETIRAIVSTPTPESGISSDPV